MNDNIEKQLAAVEAARIAAFNQYETLLSQQSPVPTTAQIQAAENTIKRTLLNEIKFKTAVLQALGKQNG